jgi:hypothetical protein
MTNNKKNDKRKSNDDLKKNIEVNKKRKIDNNLNDNQSNDNKPLNNDSNNQPNDNQPNDNNDSKKEEQRIKAEEQRIIAEQQRIKAEEQLAKAEEEIKKAEEELMKAEEERIKAEEQKRIENNIFYDFFNNDNFDEYFDDDDYEDSSTDDKSNDDDPKDDKSKDDNPKDKKIFLYIFDDLEDKNNNNTPKKNNPPKNNPPKNNKNKNIFDDDDKNNGLDDFFTILLNKTGDKNNNSNKNKKTEKKVEDFFDYFNEDTILHPINKEIKTINDLIELGLSYDPLDKKRYVINLRALNKCVEPLKDLNKMIGMKNVKEMIIDLMFFRLQNLKDGDNEMWHLVIQGTPGSGKTEIAKILGKLYYSLGIAKKDSFTPVKRSDLIGKYLGHTAKMTQEVFDNAKGGILFIDEAYSLGNPEGRDTFSKECIDTINQNLTENKDVIVFIAGYKDQLDESFFSYNPGLNRRFKMRITVDKYSASELREIYIKKIFDDKWDIMDNDLIKNIPLKFFEKNYEMFKYNGGDMENLWHLTKICHARRIFGKELIYMKKIIDNDLEKAFNNYLSNDEFKNRKDDIKKYLQNTLYS